MWGLSVNAKHHKTTARTYAKKLTNTMRKVAQLLLLVFGSVSLAHAQTLIPRAGLTISSTTADEISTDTEVTNISNMTGYTFGFGYNYPVAPLGNFMFSLQPELNYIQKGYKGNSSGEWNIGEAYYEYKGDNEFKLNYIEIPVLAKFEHGSNKFKFAAFAGPSLGFALGGKYKNTAYVDNVSEQTTVTYKSEGDIVFYRPEGNSGDTQFDHNIDFGIQGGASVTFFNRVMLDVRYGRGLTNLNHGSESKNRVIQFSIGVPINIK
jgi:hypothetical protein